MCVINVYIYTVMVYWFSYVHLTCQKCSVPLQRKLQMYCKIDLVNMDARILYI